MISDTLRSLIKQGLSIIPANEAKRPLVYWKDKANFTELEIFDLMSRISNCQWAVRLGTPSGRLLCIDVDVKYKLGFDGTIISDVRELFPDIWNRLLVERSPSGGVHFFYFVGGSEALPHSPKVASREITEDERADYIKRGVKVENSKCFLEVKCEGGLTQLFPSDGYTRVKCGGDVFGEDSIGTLTWEEHSCLMAHCSSYNEYFVKKGDLPLKVNKEEGDRYELNPFEDFNLRDKGELLKDAGWNFVYSRGEYNYYAKPDKKDKGVSASYSTVKGRYKVFTASTELEPIAYSPANLLCALEYGGDKKKMFHELVAKGFGKIKPSIERLIVKKAAKSGKPLPPNISAESEFELEIEKGRLLEEYPYGTFWKPYGEDTYRISREELYGVARELGYRKHQNMPVKITGFVVKKVKEEEFYNDLKAYIKESEDIEVFNAFEAYLQNSGKFTISRLEDLNKDIMLRSSKLMSYKFYKNGYVRIGVGGESEIELLSYEGMDRYIWEEDIKDRDFVRIRREGDFGYASDYKKGGSMIYDFLQKAIGVDDFLYQCMGYYSHEYRDQEGYLCIATEQCENPSDGGGSGKNVFWSLFESITTFKSTPASLIQKSSNLLQSWDGQKVFCMSDMPKEFDLIFFKDIITGNAVVNKKYINEYSIDIEDMCKIGASSNYSFDDADPGIKRRVKPIEFTDFFTKAGGVKAHYGKMFPKDWDEKEYQMFDNIMIDAIQTYLNNDCHIGAKQMSHGGWVKQFSQRFTHLYDFFSQNIENWCQTCEVSNEVFRLNYKHYCDDNNIKKTYTGQNINIALAIFCRERGVKFHQDTTWKDVISQMNVKGRTFGGIPIVGEEAPW